MSRTIFLVVPALFVFYSSQSLAQDINSWGNNFDCAVDWFSGRRAGKENRTDEPINRRAVGQNALSGTPTAVNAPLPVRNVLENPSPETARAYVLWSRQANEKLGRAVGYIAQATRELNAEAVSRISMEKRSAIAASGLGPVGLYYFFSPDDQTALKDVQVLNKIFQEGRLGVVGIPVRGMDEEIVQFLNETKPLFPVRKSEAEVRMIKPSETPELHLALPSEKKVLRLSSVITETAIAGAIGSIVAARPGAAP